MYWQNFLLCNLCQNRTGFTMKDISDLGRSIIFQTAAMSVYILSTAIIKPSPKAGSSAVASGFCVVFGFSGYFLIGMTHLSGCKKPWWVYGVPKISIWLLQNGFPEILWCELRALSLAELQQCWGSTPRLRVETPGAVLSRVRGWTLIPMQPHTQAGVSI